MVRNEPNWCLQTAFLVQRHHNDMKQRTTANPHIWEDGTSKCLVFWLWKNDLNNNVNDKKCCPVIFFLIELIHETFWIQNTVCWAFLRGHNSIADQSVNESVNDYLQLFWWSNTYFEYFSSRKTFAGSSLQLFLIIHDDKQDVSGSDCSSANWAMCKGIFRCLPS